MRYASFVFLFLSVGIAGAVAAWTVGEGFPPVTVDSESPMPFDAGEIDADRLGRDAAGRVVLDGAVFTGTLVKREGDALVERADYAAGLRHGLTERWYADGTTGYRATYRDGRRHGIAQTWWEDGTLRSEAHYVAGVADGVQREWYRSGAPFKELTLVNGQEEGLQRAWRENGALYTNYEARNGRIYGLKRANLCYELDDEQVVTD